ncbi:hypothetical protein BT96DRAFT_101548 [Gymnopus androsaceus JB14]|uniref:Uncharacterized protein n=1 Tax=Gymnopus androsaceus JB14 TaxID=1447944 RepID=A0A6A4HDX0_9AGAR|nr:hypothetical protein BT96DRAFT_101548 [Gymnopus androsaceus JB14]
MESSSADFHIHHSSAAGPAIVPPSSPRLPPVRPYLTRGLPTLHSDSSASLLTHLPSVARRRTEKDLPSRPISNLHDYMPPAASRSSWRGMPFSQFQRRILQDAGVEVAADQPRETPSAVVDVDIAQLQAFLASRVEEMNIKRGMLNLPAWKVPNDLSLMRHVCKVWWGEQVAIPELKRVGNGKYEIDYEVMKREMEMEEMLMDTPLIEISTAEERAQAEAKVEKALWWMDNYGPYGIARTKKTKSKRKPSVFAEIWVNIGYVFGISAKRRRDRDHGAGRRTIGRSGGRRRRARTRLTNKVFRFRR